MGRPVAGACHDGRVAPPAQDAERGAAPPPVLTVVRGDDEFLRSRALDDAVRAARATWGAELEVTRTAAAELDAVDLRELLSPSLFGEARLLVIGAVEEIGDEAAATLTGYLADPVESIVLACEVTHGTRGRATVTALVKQAQAGGAVVECRRPKGAELKRFLVGELRAAGVRQPAPEVVDLILHAVGNDLRELAAAVAQLAADTDGEVDEPAVRRYHRGRGELSGFTIAERAVEGDVAGALEELRWARSGNLAEPLVVSALAGSLRMMAGVAGAPGLDRAALARRLKTQDWKVDKARRQLRRWSPPALAEAVHAVAAADAAVKGGSPDADHSLQQAVLQVALLARDGVARPAAGAAGRSSGGGDGRGPGGPGARGGQGGRGDRGGPGGRDGS